jgi:hypothetical protein
MQPPPGLRAVRFTALSLFLTAASLASWAGCASSTSDSFADDGAGGSDSSGSTSTATGGDACPGATLCGESCTNTAFDPNNCGACGTACPAGQVCSNGACGLACAGGVVQCGDACADIQSDPANCGGCGNACAPSELCSVGQCSGVCLGGTIDCNGKCVDTQSDRENCGACGTACNPEEVCAVGQCGLTCVGGSTKCGMSCVDTDADPANCGSCGKQCANGQVCASGQCSLVCSGGSSKCGALCVDKTSDPANCGACGFACQPGQACFNGQCGLCGPGLTQCNATCVDEQKDPKSCGGCGVACAADEACYQGACAAGCGGGLLQCGQSCVDSQNDPKNCGGCGVACAPGGACVSGTCQACDSSTTDCDKDGWLVADGDCCDKPGLCGSEPEKVNPGALEVVGNGLDDNCNSKTDLFDTEDTVACDGNLSSSSQNALDYAKALGICRTTQESPPLLKDKTWGLIDAKILRADGSPLQDYEAISIRTGFGSIAPATTQGQAAVVMSSGIASDATQTMPGPNGGAPGGFNVSTDHTPFSTVDIASGGQAYSVKDWYATANLPLKPAHGLPDSPGCNASNTSEANDSAMLVFRMRAPTNAKAFSFNSYFFSAEYPEFVCTSYNDQFIALVDTPNGTPSPIANPADKNLMTYTQGGQQWPIGINIAKGTSLFAVCESQQQNPGCWDSSVSAQSCSLGAAQLSGTGFEQGLGDTCTIGGGTFWLTTAGNVIPGDIVELRVAIWDVGDSAYDSLAVIDGFQWLANATLPGTGN